MKKRKRFLFWISNSFFSFLFFLFFNLFFNLFNLENNMLIFLFFILFSNYTRDMPLGRSLGQNWAKGHYCKGAKS